MDNTLIDKITQIAAHLGPNWSAAPSELSRAEYELRRADGLTVYITSVSGGRLHIDGDWRGLTQFRPYNESLPDIHISASREPRAIARDIARRFLPAYEAMLTKLRARKAMTDTYNQRQHQIAADLLADSGGRLTSLYNSDLELVSFGPWPTLVAYPVGVRIKVSGGAVEIRADDLSPEVAAQIMRLLYALPVTR